MTSTFSWKNSVSLCSASFCTPRPNLPVTPCWDSRKFRWWLRAPLSIGTETTILTRLPWALVSPRAKDEAIARCKCGGHSVKCHQLDISYLSPAILYFLGCVCLCVCVYSKKIFKEFKSPVKRAANSIFPAPPFPIPPPTTHQNRAGESHFLETLKIHITSFLLHRLQPPTTSQVI